MSKFNYYIKNPRKIAIPFVTHYCKWLPDVLYLKFLYWAKMGHGLNLRTPKTFSEKLQWLKLYDRNPEYTKMVDKYAVKEYVASIIGEEYIIPTLGVWDRGENIEWDLLPNQFVLKTTHSGGSTGVVICKDKLTFDRENAVRVLNKSLKDEYYSLLREWPYKNVPKRIIAEKYIQPSPDTKDLPDYKFFCFNGIPKYCQVISGRGTKMCIDFFDQEWNHQPFHEPRDYQFADIVPEKPKMFNQMWDLAKELAHDKPFSRIDFYEVNNKIYFGEITFYPTSGFGGFSPTKYDEIIGGMIRLDFK